MYLLAFIFLFGYNMIKYDYFLGDENMSAVIEKIISNVKQHPDQVVIVDQGEGNYFTYRSFDDYARKVAAKLQRLGVTRRSFVTIEFAFVFAA